MYKKILLTGINGQVGHALQAVFSVNTAFGGEVVCLDRHQLDLSDAGAIRRVVQDIQPDLIINPAAYTAVDQAESEVELAYAINATAPQILAEEAANVGARLMHFSTDYVYDGAQLSPYVESDHTAPLNIYGKSKLAGENAIRGVGIPHLIFRTSWVYGAYGKNFLKTILRLASERDGLRIVADQFGAPTSANSIAHAVFAVVNRWQGDQTGVYHLVNSGRTSWHGFAMAIVEDYLNLPQVLDGYILKSDLAHIQAITTQDFPTPATRPQNSCLDCAKLTREFAIKMLPWREGLKEELKRL